MYKNILLATDLSPYTKKVTKKAVMLAKKFNAKLSIIHVFEYVSGACAGCDGIVSAIPVDAELINITEEQVREKLYGLAKELGIPKKRCHLEFGSIKHAVAEKAQQVKADLLVIGSHGRHGPALLLGSSASAIMHNVKCDLLAVRVS